ncbi:hypothetical protein [Pseudonocardia sp. T1-2H]|uniref:hypothetical protein n=1 Tax=Pseudonocardia sp. T1-2H TaxID=3128899 RepID=UPI003100B370
MPKPSTPVRTQLPLWPCLGCRTIKVAASAFCCPTCWADLPGELRELLESTFWGGRVADHLDALTTARGWFWQQLNPTRFDALAVSGV